MKAILTGSISAGFGINKLIENGDVAEQEVIKLLANGTLAEAIEVLNPETRSKVYSADFSGRYLIGLGTGVCNGINIYGPFAKEETAEEFGDACREEDGEWTCFTVEIQPTAEVVPDVVHIRVIVLCENSEGVPEFHSCSIDVTQAQYVQGEHYVLAKENAEHNGYSGLMCAFDEKDVASRQLFDLAKWIGTAPVSKPWIEMGFAVADLVTRCGGDVNGFCEQYPRPDWRNEIANGDSNLGYWEWCIHSAERDEVTL